ncbi:gamma-glutamyltransferase family protein [Sulfitobacter sp. F26204]|uniref:gamma-glutamyltransferase family protein n=1 Tax=Sulfitobacter sp. F26204 TaxID=2996014 RepID=UPI00225E5972|nr:gamma-glutamyltransferase family protein [Sulfitobacter sp. F26204]MCX7560670.1 gamma-glutamyltransferase family protein [Sulfitobacter sp. F26204]
MDMFTTRPDIRGNFGVVTSTHWIASAAGMRMLELGGNAFDAAVACGLTLQVVEPHLNGPAGDLPAIVHLAKTGETRVLCAQGIAPARATIDHYRAQGLELVPGSGFLSVVVPGAFDGWMLMLRDHGLLDLQTVMEPAISYARDGHPVLPRVAATIESLKEYFKEHWPTSAETWAPDDKSPEPWALFRNPVLAKTYQRLVDDGAAAGDRIAQIEAARTMWREGFVADGIFDYLKDREVMDVSESAHGAVLERADMANWRATWEVPLTATYHGWTISKTQSWSQGPVLLQALKLLEGFDLASMDPLGSEFVHTVVEAMKLAYADREAYYGDPDFFEVPMAQLLSEDYAAERRKLISDTASQEQRPGRIAGFEHLADGAISRAARNFSVASGVSAGEPTMSHLSEKRGDTVHIDVIDRWGNMVAATPSGGWLQSNPVIPSLGFALGSRAQMFWLEDGLPTSLKPGARPRTTLTPTIAEKDGQRIAFGTPGGDQQDQWQLIWFLRFVHHGYGLQQGLDAPLFHSEHFQSSFYPRAARPGEVTIEPSFGADEIEALRQRGHKLVIAEPMTVGRLTAAIRDADGSLRAGATPRLMQAYAMGR